MLTLEQKLDREEGEAERVETLLPLRLTDVVCDRDELPELLSEDDIEWLTLGHADTDVHPLGEKEGRPLLLPLGDADPVPDIELLAEKGTVATAVIEGDVDPVTQRVATASVPDPQADGVPQLDALGDPEAVVQLLTEAQADDDILGVPVPQHVLDNDEEADVEAEGLR